MTCGAALTSKATPFLSGVVFFCASFAGNATPPSLSFPVDCRLGETCFIQQYVDHDPSIAARDYTCGPQSYDGHQGTDFRLSDLAALTRNVAVLAAADGIVQATRDGVLDQGIAAMPEGQDCGNGVVIDHGDGWQSQYCQLAQGSIAVTQGQNVQAGARLGVLGLSGRTEFPHLHFTLRHNGTLIDPFNQSAEGHCGLDTAQLWHPALPAPTQMSWQQVFPMPCPIMMQFAQGARICPWPPAAQAPWWSAALPIVGRSAIVWSLKSQGRTGRFCMKTMSH